MSRTDKSLLQSRNRRTLFAVSGIVVGMLGLAYASVPLYRLFCQVTGFGGTTQVASVESEAVLDRTITVRFNASRDPSLPWSFQPEQRSVEVRIGETGLAYYRADNRSPLPVVGVATYNVTPLKAGIYFNKLACFCFENQVLQPGEGIDMPVSFFVDPAIADDPSMDDVTTITLSYTFFRATDQGQAELAGAAAGDDAAVRTNRVN
jgi:cytochrome c oxidase assembly protein subunit 11